MYYGRMRYATYALLCYRGGAGVRSFRGPTGGESCVMDGATNGTTTLISVFVVTRCNGAESEWTLTNTEAWVKKVQITREKKRGGRGAKRE